MPSAEAVQDVNGGYILLKLSSLLRIKLVMPHNAAACIAALRATMEALVVEVTQNPEIISQLDQLNEHMLSVIRQISRPTAAGINLITGSTRLAPASLPRNVYPMFQWYL